MTPGRSAARIVIAGTLALAGVARLAPGPPAPAASPRDVVATGISRPLELALDGRALVVLAQGARGDVAGELHRIDLDGGRPVDATRLAPRRLGFADPEMTTLGSLARDPASHDLFLGEANGRRIWRLTPDGALTVYATGLRRLGGGSSIAVDRRGRLLVVDYVDPTHAPGEDRLPGLEELRDEDYRGPLVFALGAGREFPLPRRLDRLAPLYPRGWNGAAGGARLPRVLAVAPLASGDLALLTSEARLLRLGAEGRTAPWARLPSGEYHRPALAATPEGGVYVNGGFHLGRVFHVAPDGRLDVVAADLADPEGLALGPAGEVYVAEATRHRILQIR